MATDTFDNRTEIIGELYMKLRRALQESDTYKALYEKEKKSAEIRKSRIKDLHKMLFKDPADD